MRGGNKAIVSTFASKCKTILASNWQGHLNTIKADAKGSKGDIHTSKVKYIVRKGKPYIWVPEKDLHNVNAIIDERGSFAVSSPYPGLLATLLKSIEKLPARLALTGDVVPVKEEKAKLIAEELRELVLAERKAIREATYTVSGVLSSANPSLTSQSENLQELLGDAEKFSVYKFDIRTCKYIDANGGNFEVDVQDMERSKADVLAPFSAKLIDGINRSAARRRALMLFCFIYSNTNVKDAYALSVDCKGFNVLGRVPSPVQKDGSGQYRWKEFQFTLKDVANDIESFCCQLVEMEEETLKTVSGFSGLK